jgi:hypothetical protein
MTIRALGYIQFKTHRVLVSKDTDHDRIYCFKATDTRCDIESFDSEELAADYILAPFPALVYELVLGGETDSDSAETGAG